MTCKVFVLKKKKKTGGKGACSSFIERCFAFIGENAVDTVKTSAFCNLPKDALVKLISSDYLGLEEEDVWRAVLNWAKYQVHQCSYKLSFSSSLRILLIELSVCAGRRYSTNATLDRGGESTSLPTSCWSNKSREASFDRQPSFR